MIEFVTRLVHSGHKSERKKFWKVPRLNWHVSSSIWAFFAPSGPSSQWKINSPWFFQLQGGRRISQNASIRDKIRFSAKVHIWSKISSWCMVHVWFWMKSLVRLFKMAEIASLQCVSSLLNLSKAEILIFSLIFDQMDLLTKNSDMSDLKTEKTQTSE